jgi:single-strand DNA-binding protein
MNFVALYGNLGQDGELRFTPGGQAVLTLRLATTERFKDSSGQWKDKSEWHTVIVWGKRGESLSQFTLKGIKLCVEGRLQTRQWEDRNGGKRYSTEIVASNVELAGNRGQRPGGDEAALALEYAESAPSGAVGDDDIPF